MQKYKLFGLAPPIWVAQYIYSIDIQRIIKCESKRCQSQVACSTPIALEWDAAFKNLNDPSGRSVSSVHEQGYK